MQRKINKSRYAKRFAHEPFFLFEITEIEGSLRIF